MYVPSKYRPRLHISLLICSSEFSLDDSECRSDAFCDAFGCACCSHLHILSKLVILSMSDHSSRRGSLDYLFNALVREKISDVQSRLSNPNLLKANTLIKKLKGHAELRLAITAFKIGIPFELLSQHLDFATFSQKNAIHRYLLVYNHELKYDENKIWILYEGVYTDWKSISGFIVGLNGEIKGQYSRHGIIRVKLHEWNVLNPFIYTLPVGIDKDPENISTGLPVLMKHDWGNRYILDICAWIIANPRLTGDHLWHRLKTPNGEVYSIGQYRPRKLRSHEQFLFPMKIKTCQFFAPDLCEFWSGPYTKLSIEISENQFFKMKGKMENDQNRQEHVYQLFDENCVDYTMSICNLAGIDFPTKLHISDILIKSHALKNTKNYLWNSNLLPDFFKSIWHYSWVFIMNGISLLLGAGMIDNQVRFFLVNSRLEKMTSP